MLDTYHTFLLKDFFTETTYGQKMIEYSLMYSTKYEQLNAYIFKVLMSRYGNSWIRYDTKELFWNDLAFRYDITVRNLQVKNSIYLELYSMTIAELKKVDIKNSKYKMDYTAKFKQADTPTDFNLNLAEFDNKYTNLINDSVKGDTRNNDSYRARDIFDLLDKMKQIKGEIYEEINNEFCSLFMQID